MTLKTRDTYPEALKAIVGIPEAVEFLEVVIKKLQHRETLPPEFKDHALTGGYLRGCRSVIVGWIALDPNDEHGEQLTFILIYRLTTDALVLENIGQHDDLYAAYRP